MSIWDLEMMVKSAIPAWVPFALLVVACIVYPFLLVLVSKRSDRRE